MAGERGVSIDEAGFEAAMEQTKARSRAAGKLSADDWVQVHAEQDSTFVGYDSLESPCRILRYREVESKNKKFYQFVLDSTPFYPEGGGQVGDAGTLTPLGSTGDKNAKPLAIFDTKKKTTLSFISAANCRATCRPHSRPKSPQIAEQTHNETTRLLTCCTRHFGPYWEPM